MTYIELVNNILIRLRERKVETVNETGYSTLVGLIINDAMEQVESAWDWSALRTTLQANTVADTFSYELNSGKSNLTVIDVTNNTSSTFLSYKTSHEFNDKFLNPETGTPTYYSFNGTSVDGDTLVDLYPIPDGEYVIRFNVVARSAPFTLDADVLRVPSSPVLLLAYAMAVEERGEDGAQTAASAFSVAQRSLTDALALDASKHPEDILWVTV